MRLTVGLAACILLVAAEDKGKAKKAADPLTGTWKAVSVVANGDEVEQFKGTLFTYKDGTLTRKNEQGEQVSSYKLDPTKKPATIDITAKGGRNEGQTRKGIYEVKGDDLKVCVAFMPDADRPKEFASEAGSGNILITLKREAGAKGDAKSDKSKK
jgi:uncharacterized protein (TIGR03067 family)